MVTLCKITINNVLVGRIIFYDHCCAITQGTDIVYYFWKKGLIIFKIRELQGLKLIFRGRRPRPYDYKIKEE